MRRGYVINITASGDYFSQLCPSRLLAVSMAEINREFRRVEEGILDWAQEMMGWKSDLLCRLNASRFQLLSCCPCDYKSITFIAMVTSEGSCAVRRTGPCSTNLAWD